MSGKRQSITTLLAGTAVLLLGLGLLMTLLPVRAKLEAFSTTTVGWMGGAFFLGFGIGCLVGPPIVRRVGHIRAFAGFAALMAALALAFQLFPVPYAWLVARAFTGICSAVLFMVIESWLNEQATNETRGKVLSVYIIVVNVMTMGGQLMLNLYPPERAEPFILAAILVCVSLAPIALVRAVEPTPPPTARLRFAELYRTSPVGFVGCVLFGLVDASFWSLGPVFAQDRGFTVAGVTFFMASFMLGGTISQWPIGWISDRMDRRLVIAFCCAGAMATGVSLFFLESHLGWLPWVLAGLHGAFMLPLYPLILAHANDWAPTDKLVETSSALLLVYSGGAVIGPLVVGPLMEGVDAGWLFLGMTVVLGALVLFVLYRVGRRPIGQVVSRVVYVPFTKSSQAVYELETDEEETTDSRTGNVP